MEAARKGIQTKELLRVAEKEHMEPARRFKNMKRLMNIVSRGGSIIFAWMEMTGKENLFYEHYDRILEICCKYADSADDL